MPGFSCSFRLAIEVLGACYLGYEASSSAGFRSAAASRRSSGHSGGPKESTLGVGCARQSRTCLRQPPSVCGVAPGPSASSTNSSARALREGEGLTRTKMQRVNQGEASSTARSKKKYTLLRYAYTAFIFLT